MKDKREPKQDKPEQKDIFNPLKGVWDEIQKLFPLGNQDPDNQLQERQEIYQNIAHFLQDKFGQAQPVCLKAAYILCGEVDASLNGEGEADRATQKLVDAAREVVLTIKVHYFTIKDSAKYHRKTEIFFAQRNDKKPGVFRISEDLLWENLPSDVREIFIREGREQVSFKIYPQESEK